MNKLQTALLAEYARKCMDEAYKLESSKGVEFAYGHLLDSISMFSRFKRNPAGLVEEMRIKVNGN